jgi:lysophospholipase L1-like esterase
VLRFYVIVILVWLVLLLAALLLHKKRRIGKILLYIVYATGFLLLIEFTCLIGFYFKSGRWLFREPRNQNYKLFEPHPYLGAMPVKGVSVKFHEISYHHNAQGFRGRDFPAKSEKIRIVCIGGSTTYGTNTSNNQTWPYYLDSLLAPGYEVLNLGVPGHSTVEHIIMASLVVPEYKPDIILIHCGMNDLRNQHILGLKPDYSDFHAPHLFHSLGFYYENTLPRLASLRFLVLVMQKLDIYPVSPYRKITPRGTVSTAIDTVALGLYERNLNTLAVVCRRYCPKVIFVPQVMLYDAFKGSKLRWWIPYVPDEELIGINTAYNACTKKVADYYNSNYAEDVQKYKWATTEFADAGHLNAKGNLIFAQGVRDAVLQKVSAY